VSTEKDTPAMTDATPRRANPEVQQRQAQADAARQAAAQLQAWRQGAISADRRQAARAAAVRSIPRLPGREEPGGRGR